MESDFHGALPAGDFLDTGPLFFLPLVRPDGRLAQYSVRGFFGVGGSRAVSAFRKEGVLSQVGPSGIILARSGKVCIDLNG